MGLGRPPVAPKVDKAGAPINNIDSTLQKVVTETDDLRATKLAFILGRRSSEMMGVAGRQMVDGNGDSINAIDGVGGDGSTMYDYGFQLTINNNYSPGVPGTERFQKLCSFEYLQRYFTNVLCNKGINLGTEYTNAARAVHPGSGAWESGLMRATNAAASVREAQLVANPVAGAVGDDIGAKLAKASMLNMPDLCRLMGYVGSEAAGIRAGAADDAFPTNVSEIRQGIFTRDLGPFLRGKGVETNLLAGTPHASQFGVSDVNTGATTWADPFHVSRCAGDELAFSLLERIMEQRGFTDWRPDGIVLSLGANDPSDKLSDEALAARDGQLFNVRVQGPAIGASWTGDPALETMPLDKVFVVIVADCWWGDLSGTSIAGVKNFVDKVAPLSGQGAPVQPTLAELQVYLKERDEQLSGGNLVTKTTLGAFNAAAEAQMDAGAPADASARNTGTSRLCNFRVQLATSSQMINYSGLRFGRDQTQVLGNEAQTRDEFVRVPNQSRMGLRLGKNGGEYIVGGWCIGNVLDTSASRGSMPGTGSSIGVRTAPNSMALNINVQIDWWDPDRMWRCFMNKEAVPFEKDADGQDTAQRVADGTRSGSLAQRYSQTVPDKHISDINRPRKVPGAEPNEPAEPADAADAL